MSLKLTPEEFNSDLFPPRYFIIVSLDQREQASNNG